MNIFIPVLFLAPFIWSCNGNHQTGQDAPASSLKKEITWTEADRQFLLSELDRTTDALIKEVEYLSPDQWHFKEDPYRWDIAEIIEHLTVQNELHYREIYAASNFPEMPEYLPVTTGQDDYFLNYATDPKKSQAKWFLQPIGRFESKRRSIDAFLRARDGIRDFIEATKIDLRRHFTFRNKGGDKKVADIKIGEVRDLHQLILTGVAHTDRHLKQIRNIKKNKFYPRNI